jgi:hypothetical protein
MFKEFVHNNVSGLFKAFNLVSSGWKFERVALNGIIILEKERKC